MKKLLLLICGLLLFTIPVYGQGEFGIGGIKGLKWDGFGLRAGAPADSFIFEIPASFESSISITTLIGTSFKIFNTAGDSMIFNPNGFSGANSAVAGTAVFNYKSRGGHSVIIDSLSAYISVYDSPVSNVALMQLGTDADADRFKVDEDGDVTNDGDLTTAGTATLNGAVNLGDAIGDVTTLNGSITSNQTHSAAATVFYFKTGISATSGAHRTIRARVEGIAESAATGETKAIYAQAVTNDSKYGGVMTGIHANFIAKNASTTVDGRAIFAEAESEATATAIQNVYAIYARTKFHVAPSGAYVGIMIDNEKMATGFPTDTYLGMKSTSWGAAENSAAYGIDMNGITSLTTADWRMHNGALFNNSSASLLTITEATVDIDGNLTASTLTSDAEITATGELRILGEATALYLDYGSVGAEDHDMFIYFGDDANNTAHSIKFDDGETRFYISKKTTIVGAVVASAFTTDNTTLDEGFLGTAGAVNILIDPNQSGAATLTLGQSGDGDIITTAGTPVYLPNALSNAGTSVADDAAITVTHGIMRMVGADADAVLDTDPAIVDGTTDGQIVIIQGTADGNTVTIADNVNTQLAGGLSMTLGDGDILMLKWDSNASFWLEISRSDN